MAIIAASVEANGWVLRVTHTAGLGAFASYTLDPNGSPRLTLAALSLGFVPAGGVVVAATPTRGLVGTKPLRRPVQATSAGVRAPKSIDETDNGNGTVTVRIALSQHVYASDTALSLTVQADWRLGEGAQTIAVTNGSTLAAPQPLVRWSDVPFQLREGSFDLEVVVASQHPLGTAPVAGVRFTVYDNTTLKTFWATALSTSTVYASGGTGRGVRVYRVTVDPTVATALTRGLLRCDYKVFPWIGAARVSDTADTALTAVASSNSTPSMTGLSAAASSNAAQVPFVVAYNASGTWITPRYAYVVADGSGATAASASLVSTNPATAAVTPCNGVTMAIESLRLHAQANAGVGTLAAANGQGSTTQSIDACVIRLKAGTHVGWGTGAVTLGVNSGSSWVIFEGDPADPDPRTNVILRGGTGAASTRSTRTQFRKMAIEGTGFSHTSTTNWWGNDIEFRAVTGSENITTVPFSVAGTWFLTNSRWWKHGLGPTRSGTLQIPLLVRNCEVERTITAAVVLNNRRLPSGIGGVAIGSDANSTVAGVGQDRLTIGNDLRYTNGSSFIWSTLLNANAPAYQTFGTTYNVAARQAFINNVCEGVGPGAPMILPTGENGPAVITETIVEGNTLTGDRYNMDYNTGIGGTVAQSDAVNAIAILNRRANNVCTMVATKHDMMNDTTVMGQRVGVTLASTRNRPYAVGAQVVIQGSPANIYACTVAGTTASSGGPTGSGAAIVDGTATWAWVTTENRQHGYGPQRIGSWPTLYGVGQEGNIDLQPPAQAIDVAHEFFGLGGAQLSVDGISLTVSPFTLDKSGTNVGPSQMPWLVYDPANTGGGNYVPVAASATGAGLSASYLLSRARNANIDRDQAGRVRGATFAAGALEPLAAGLMPAPARHATSSRASQATWDATLSSATARSFSRGSSPTIGWTVGLIPRAARSALASGTARLSWSGVLRPPGDALRSFASSTLAIFATGVDLAPASTRHPVFDRTRPLVLPGTPAPADRTLTVTGDFRVTIAG